MWGLILPLSFGHGGRCSQGTAGACGEASPGLALGLRGGIEGGPCQGMLKPLMVIFEEVLPEKVTHMMDDGALEMVPVAPDDAPRCDLKGTTACLKALEMREGTLEEGQEQLSAKLIKPLAFWDCVESLGVLVKCASISCGNQNWRMNGDEEVYRRPRGRETRSGGKSERRRSGGGEGGNLKMDAMMSDSQRRRDLFYRICANPTNQRRVLEHILKHSAVL